MEWHLKETGALKENETAGNTPAYVSQKWSTRISVMGTIYSPNITVLFGLQGEAIFGWVNVVAILCPLGIHAPDD